MTGNQESKVVYLFGHQVLRPECLVVLLPAPEPTIRERILWWLMGTAMLLMQLALRVAVVIVLLFGITSALVATGHAEAAGTAGLAFGAVFGAYLGIWLATEVS